MGLRRREGTRILVAHEKHSTRYMVANTLEELDQSALKLLRERLEWGYIYNPEAEGEETNEWSKERHAKEREMASMTDEAIAAIPSDEIRVKVRKEVKEARQAVAARVRDREEYARLVELSQKKSTITTRKNRPEAQYSEAWEELCARDGGEYEQVGLEYLETADE